MTSETRSGFGNLLRRYRIDAGLTQEELAERAGISARGLSGLERGSGGRPRFDTVRRLAQALQLSPEQRVVLSQLARRANEPATSARIGARDPSLSSATPQVRSFLLADIRDYTRFTLEHGDEAAARLTAYFAGLTREVVEIHEGKVIELRRDEALAVFPSCRQALRAAAELQGHFARQAADDPSLPLHVGIGLDAGEAIPVEGGYRGTALNLAARLCSLAGSGEVLTTETIISLARKVEGLTYAERGSVELKGFTEPVRVMAIVPEAEREQAERIEKERAGTAAAGSDGRLPIGGFLGSLPRDPIVAREPELSRAFEVVEAAASGQGRTLLLLGEAGVGKTRLAQEITRKLHDRGFLVAAGRCYESEQTVPYYPFLEALARIYDQAPPALRAAALTRWPYLGALLPDQIPLPPASGGQDEQVRVFRSVTAFLQSLTETMPISLLLDDLHWADSASLKLLHVLSRDTRSHPILLLGTYRDVEIAKANMGPLSAVLLDLRREGVAERIAVRRLDREGTGQLVAAIAGQMEVSKELSTSVHKRTEGNPYFVKQVMQVIMERGGIVPDGTHRPDNELTDIEVPEGVRTVIAHRLARLSEEAQEVLKEASVLGQWFLFEDLLVLSGREEEALEGALADGEEAGLIGTDDGEHYTFDHALTQQTLYSDLLARRRRRLHLRAAEAIEGLAEHRREQRLAELARHFLQGANQEKALVYAVAAGDAAAQVFAFGEAEKQYRTAVALAREREDRDWEAAALEKLGDVLERVGRVDEAIKPLEGAAELYRTRSYLEGEGRVVAAIGLLNYQRGLVDASIERVRELRQRLEVEIGPSVALARLSFAEGTYYLAKQRHEEAVAAHGRAARVARDAGDSGLQVRALLGLGPALRDLGRVGEALPLLGQALAIARERGDVWEQAFGEQMLGEWCLTRAELDDAYHHFQRSHQAFESLHHPDRIAWCLAMQGLSLYHRGDWTDAGKKLEGAQEILPQLGDSWGRWMTLRNTSRLLIDQGRWEEAEQVIRELEQVAERSHDLLWKQTAVSVRNVLDIMRGHVEEALGRLDQLDHVLGTGGTLPLERLSRPLVYSELGRYGEALDLTVRDLDEARKRGNHQWRLELLVLAATIAYRSGLKDEADHYMARALPDPDTQGMSSLDGQQRYRCGGTGEDSVFASRYPYLEGKLRYERGRARGARKDLEVGLAIFRQLGARPYVERTEQALAQL